MTAPWRELLRAAASPLVVLDPAGVVALASGEALRLLGKAEDEVVGRHSTEVLPPGAPVEASADGWSIVKLGDRHREEHEHLLLDFMREQERERGRIAAGVHDDSLQVITAAMLRLQQLRHRLHDPDALQSLTRLEESISLAADRLRRLIFDYRPRALERSGLTAAVRDSLSRMRDDYGLDIRLRDELSRQPPVPTRLLLFRILQEALANVGQHAKAEHVEVALSERAGGYLVCVADDGVGISEPAAPGHLGLTLMSERAEFAGGWFRLDSTPGSGTTVTVWVPAGGGGE